MLLLYQRLRCCSHCDSGNLVQLLLHMRVLMLLLLLLLLLLR